MSTFLLAHALLTAVWAASPGGSCLLQKHSEVVGREQATLSLHEQTVFAEPSDLSQLYIQKGTDPRLTLVGEQLAQLVSGTGRNITDGHLVNFSTTLQAIVVNLLEEAKAMTVVAQGSAQQEADAFDNCYSIASHVEKFANELQDHVQCRKEASALMQGAYDCNTRKAILADTREMACTNYRDFKAADHSCVAIQEGESLEAWALNSKNHFASLYTSLTDKKARCESASTSYEDADCGPDNSAFATKESACNATYIRLESHSCDAVTSAVQLSGSYDECYEAKKQDYEERDAEDELEQQRELNSRLAKRLSCLIDTIKEGDDTSFKIDNSAFEECVATGRYDTSDLVVAWPPTPAKNSPVVPTLHPCNEEYQQKISDQLVADARVPQCTPCVGAPRGAEVTGRVVYTEGRGGAKTDNRGKVEVEEGVDYIVGFEILRNDLGDGSEYVTDVIVDGHSLGECHPDGGDYDCTFFQCPFTETVITASSSTIDVNIRVTGHSWDCDCDKQTWECSAEGSVSGRTPMTAVGRFTLTPSTKAALAR